MRPGARWVARADHHGDGWQLGPPEPWDPLRHMRVLLDPGDASVVAGFDVPIGVPLDWARAVGVRSFRQVLERMADGGWPMFDQAASSPDDIAPERPFYPRAPGGTNRMQLVQALGLADPAQLLRRCDHAVPGAMPAAAPLFWLVGAQQVGRAALTAWREVLEPATARPHVRLWPMDGPLLQLAQPGATVIAEAYPRAAYTWPLGFPRSGWSKRRQADRAARGLEAIAWAAACPAGIRMAPALRAALRDGFGPEPSGEDPFDAVMGALQVIAALEGLVPDAPADLRGQRLAVEGWMLGRPA